MLFVSASVGVSKSGALTKVRTPVVLLIENFAESAPPVIDQETVSFAVKVVTAVWFSLTVMAEGPVITGAMVSIESVSKLLASAPSSLKFPALSEKAELETEIVPLLVLLTFGVNVAV